MKSSTFELSLDDSFAYMIKLKFPSGIYSHTIYP